MGVMLRHELSKGIRIKSICYIQQILKFLLFLPCGLKEKTVRISIKMMKPVSYMILHQSAVCTWPGPDVPEA